MTFGHAAAIWDDYPQLVAGVLAVGPISAAVDVRPRVANYEEAARSRLETQTESDLAEIKAWRQAFARMRLKPTQYRCAAESLLRRFRKDGSLPRIHPLIDLCNAVSLAFAIPVAVFDAAKIGDDLEVRHASGAEIYETFSGQVEHPDEGEVIFADDAGRAHARRWTNRQSGYSAVRPGTSSALIVAEAMHDRGRESIDDLIAAVTTELELAWSVAPASKVLSSRSPRFDFREAAAAERR